MSKAARAGPVRPGYLRRTSGYLVSVDVRRKADRLAREYSLRLVDEWPILPLKVHCVVYSVAADDDVDDLLNRLRDLDDVESAQRLQSFEVLAERGKPDPYADLQHSLESLGLAEAHRWSLGEGAHITIIDTGADVEHPELHSQIVTHEDFVGDGPFEKDAHGTAVAGIIAAAANNGIGIAGIAPSAEVSVLKACWYFDKTERAVCDSFTLAKALSRVVETVPQVVNLSIGGPADPLLARLLELAQANGTVVVAASSDGSEEQFPADVDGVLVAGPDGSTATGVRYSRRPPLQAPGEDILVPVPGGGFDYASGTSLSAAHVTGIVALLVATRAGLTSDDVRELLEASRAAPALSVNACRALAALLRESGCGDTAISAQSP